MPVGAIYCTTRERARERSPDNRKGKQVKEYVVIVKLGDEAISLTADNSEHAIERAKDIIAEQYSYDLSRSKTVSYEIESEVIY